MLRNKFFYIFLLLLGCIGCREEFTPPIDSINETFLVVDGVLNTGTGGTTVRLTRTYKLDDTARLRGELNAQVVVEGADNSVQPLQDYGNGNYFSPQLNLTIGNEYRLKIRTANGKEYLSKYVIARQTPPIDSIGWKRNAEGLQVYVNTSDPAGNTRYYRWEYDETWEIRAYYQSLFKYENSVVTERQPHEMIYQCWKYNSNSNIIIGTSTRLADDVIFQAPLSFMPNGDEKLSWRYSILVRQYALDKEGYEFYELMKRNTESLGTLFDPQPSEITGNVYCESDPSEPVIGYISASSIIERRHFINNSELENWRYSQFCPGIEVANDPDSLDVYFNGGYMPVEAIYSPMGAITAYFSATPTCASCVARGGSTARPSYW